LIVTRGSSDTKLGLDFQKQVFSNPQPLMLASGVLMAMAAFPGLPKIPFLVLGSSVGVIAWRLRQKSAATEKAALPTAVPARESLDGLLRVEPLAMEVGLGLVQLVEGGQSSPLLRRIASIRRQLATELGYILPPVRVTDNLTLKAREYTISIKGVEVAR
jgi:flagellar biosynthesis protein FlhA